MPPNRRRVERQVDGVAPGRKGHVRTEHARVDVRVRVAHREHELPDREQVPGPGRVRLVAAGSPEDGDRAGQADARHDEPVARDRRHEGVEHADQRAEGRVHHPQRRPADVGGAGAHAARSCGGRAGLQEPALGEVGQGQDQPVDLGVGVRRRHLHAEADLVARHQRVGGQRHVDAAVEQHPPDHADLLMVGQRHLDHREAGVVRRVRAQPFQAVQHARRLVVDRGPQQVAARLVHVEAGQHGGQRRDRGRPRVEVGRGGHLQHVLDRGGAGDEGQQRRVRLREAAHQDQVLVALVDVTHQAVAAGP